MFSRLSLVKNYSEQHNEIRLGGDKLVIEREAAQVAATRMWAPEKTGRTLLLAWSKCQQEFGSLFIFRWLCPNLASTSPRIRDRRRPGGRPRAIEDGLGNMD